MRPALSYRQIAVRLRNNGDDVADVGNAVIEFIFVAVLILVPLVYFVVAVASVQRSSVAVTHAAREAGRAFATADSTDEGLQRAEVAVRLALADQGLSDDANLRYVEADKACQSDTIAPLLSPGAQFAVCVVRYASLPGVPSLISGRGITTVGRYVLHIDDYRVVAP